MAISKEVARKLAALLSNTAYLEEKTRRIKPERVSSERLLDEMWDIKLIVDKIVDELEAQDENMDPETTKLGSVDELFSANPVTDYISARFEYAKGDRSPQVTSKMLAAAKQLKEEASTPDKAELYARVKSYDEITTHELMVLMEDIEQVFKDAEGYTSQDIEMLRFFFSNIPTNRKIDIDVASDEDIKAMWDRQKFVRDIWAI
ncbi:hypothetical protein Goe24_00400 [Bacillus phage vB_BsuM-Goe24]|nr:hypothetical protein [Bacillus phage BM-P1]WCS69420.1 hypothetical protein Goe24_00400 [Bacillus phage vB_BsuM-Goe24]